MMSPRHFIQPSPALGGQRGLVAFQQTLSIRTGIGILVAAVWLVGASFALKSLWSYNLKSGGKGQESEYWSASSLLKRDPGVPTLVMFVHPRCPCSRASLGELAWLTTRLQGRIQTFVLFFTPSLDDKDWMSSDFWRSASAIPGVQAKADLNGKEAALFGAETSGHVFLFDVKGEKVFSGGITAARGHSGESPGRRAILDFVVAGRTPLAHSPVYGCSLLSHMDRKGT